MVKEILLAGAGGFCGQCVEICRFGCRRVAAAPGRIACRDFRRQCGGFSRHRSAGCLAAAGRMAGVRHGGFLRRIHHFFRLSLETVRLMRSGQVGMAAAYAAGSVIVCLLFAGLGLWLGGKLSR